ncbi:MAG: hypothetical protein PHE84_10455 [bacterium]|nr:hypothetical protein [bacterium]
MITRKGIVFFALLALTISPHLLACGGGEKKLSPVNVDLSEPGPYQTGVYHVTLYDTSRPTDVNGTYPGDVSRTLVTEIRYPSAAGGEDSPLDLSGGPYPLIVLSHGFMAMGRAYTYFTQHLASYGYVVAAPDFPLTNILAPGGANPMDVVNQPGDVSFIIDRMLDFSAAPGGLLSGGIDPDHIGIAGHSQGALTVLLSAYAPGYLDERVDAVFPMAPLACCFQKDFFRNRPVPLLIAGGTYDIIMTYQENVARPYERASAPKYLMEVLRGNHMRFSDVDLPEQLGVTTLIDSITPAVDQAMADFENSVGKAEECGLFSQMIKPDLVKATDVILEPYLQRKLVKIYGTAFFEIYLKDKEEYKYFFTPDFTQTTPDAIIKKEE